MADNGWLPHDLLNIRRSWNGREMSIKDSYGDYWVRTIFMVNIITLSNCWLLDLLRAQETWVLLLRSLLLRDSGDAMDGRSDLQDANQLLAYTGIIVSLYLVYLQYLSPLGTTCSIRDSSSQLVSRLCFFSLRSTSYCRWMRSSNYLFDKSFMLIWFIFRFSWALVPLPFSWLMFIYDEARKYFIRRNPDGIVARATYY